MKWLLLSNSAVCGLAVTDIAGNVTGPIFSCIIAQNVYRIIKSQSSNLENGYLQH